MTPTSLTVIFEEILEDLRNQYVLMPIRRRPISATANGTISTSRL